MAVYYPAGCEDQIPDHICDPCEDKESGRVGAAAFILDTFDFSDPTNPAEWQSGINSGEIIVLPNIRGTFDGGAEVEGPGYGRQATEVTGFNYQSNFKDPNYGSNGNFYNKLKNSKRYRFAFVTASKTHISDTPVSIIPKNPVTENTTDQVVWDVTVKWAQPDLVIPVDTPPGIFDQCFATT